MEQYLTDKLIKAENAISMIEAVIRRSDDIHVTDQTRDYRMNLLSSYLKERNQIHEQIKTYYPTLNKILMAVKIETLRKQAVWCKNQYERDQSPWKKIRWENAENRLQSALKKGAIQPKLNLNPEPGK